MDLDLKDRPVVITGGASNIGRAIVLAFASEGARVALIDSDQEQANRTADTAREIGASQVSVITADLAHVEEAQAAVIRSASELNGIEILVNNVGWSVPDPFRRTDAERWRKEININLMSAFAATASALDIFVPQRRGSVVTVSSDAAWGEAGIAVYGAAKAGVISFMKSLALEHGRDGIRFNAVTPGVVVPKDPEALGAGSLWKQRSGLFTQEQLEAIVRRVPLRRLTEGEDVARAVLFLASERTARQLTGQVLSVSGGFVMP